MERGTGGEVVLTLSTRSDYQTLLDAAALQPSDAPAITYLSIDAPPVTVTRADFARHARAYGSALRAMGIAPRDLVIVAHTQNLESIYAFWGALLIGAIPSMFPTLTEKLDPDIYMANMAELVRVSAVRAVLTTDEFAPALAERVGCPVYGSTALLAALDDQPFAPYAPDPDEIAFLQHSSGTTGLQKGVALAHRAVLNHLASYGDALDLRADDVVVSWLPLYHDMGLIAGFLLPLIQGIPLVLMSPFEWVKSPALLFRAINDYGGTLCWLPNFAYNHCARRIRQRDLEGLSAASMRMFINCSEPVYYESHELFLERFAPLGVTPSMLEVSYAMAENTFAVTQTLSREIPAPRRDRPRCLANRSARCAGRRRAPRRGDQGFLRTADQRRRGARARREQSAAARTARRRDRRPQRQHVERVLSPPRPRPLPRRLVSHRRPGLPRR